MTAKPSSEFLHVDGYGTWPIAAVRLAVDLENRGFTMREGAEGKLIVIPPSGNTLSAGDMAAIRQWKLHLLAILAYCKTQAQQ